MKKFLLGSLALGALLPVTPSALGYSIGYYFNNKVAHGLGGMVGSLRSTPEPSSLFLLGGVLAGMALLVFWKAAKAPKEF
jgi:hypothetical protein